MVAFCQNDGIDERAATDWTHEIVVVWRDIVEQS